MDKTKLHLSLDKSIEQFLKFSDLGKEYKKIIMDVFSCQRDALLEIIDLAEESNRYKTLLGNYKLPKE